MKSYYDRELCVGEGTVSEEQFIRAWVLHEQVVGCLRDRKLIRGALGCVLVAALLLWAGRSLSMPVAAATALVCACGLFFSCKMLPDRVKKEAADIYQSGKILSAPMKLRITCEGFQYTNPYETLEGSWSETAFCAEDDECFAFCENRDRSVLILRKEWISPETCAALSEKLQEIFAGRWQRFRESGKKDGERRGT